MVFRLLFVRFCKEWYDIKSWYDQCRNNNISEIVTLEFVCRTTIFNKRGAIQVFNVR